MGMCFQRVGCRNYLKHAESVLLGFAPPWRGLNGIEVGKYGFSIANFIETSKGFKQCFHNVDIIFPSDALTNSHPING